MKLLKVLAIGATIGGVALATAHEKVSAAEWTPRTVQQISADIAKTNGKEYTIVWGDTLSGISQATNMSVRKLADMNKIANVDLIYAGNKLVFSGNVATVQNNKGETVAQSVIQNEDKVVATQPVGQPVQGTTSNNTTNSATQNTTTPSTDNTVTGNTQTGGQTTENAGSTTPSTPENNSGTTQTPTQPDNNQTGSTGNTTTPSQPNNGGNQNGITDGNSGTTTPSQPQAPTIVVGKVGNSGMIFDTVEEANKWANQQFADPNSQWGNNYSGFWADVIIYSDGTQKYTVDFYK
ncbi:MULTISPECIES: LysM peptidoglycan-binding domain-containing protein [Enterococcus]|uniref:LysM peptidoglycan-binding domain-containing protein n=1 Tax=Enterococcus TaxID=1350 RepID=UPI002DB7CECC|nr:LysM peptidoglycan-binding domain-containing protein [Enterococcus hirae]MEB7518627.1 LysM peptidoglycan-binding domain-containing protein [Enterococcus hirae]